MDSKLRDFQQELTTLTNHLSEIAQEHQLEKDVQTTVDDVMTRLQSCKPSLMFYGIYNAGKSSLLNGLFAEHLAPVGDIPTTNAIHAYQWQGYQLVDTPGINGPEKDYKLSKNEISKHNVIMFVIDDSDSFDNKLVAEEIVQILMSDKPLIIVLNNKQASSDESIRERVQKKLYININNIAEKIGFHNIEKKYSFITVNAISAYRAKTEKKQALLKKSKIEDLELLIMHHLKENEGMKVFIPPANLVLKLIHQLLHLLNQQLDSSADRILSEQIHNLYELKVTALQRLQNRFRIQFMDTYNIMYHHAIQGNDLESHGKQLHDQLAAIANEELERLIESVSLKLNTLRETITFLDDFSIKSIKNINLSTQEAPDSTNLSSSITHDDLSMEQLLTTILQNTIYYSGATPLVEIGVELGTKQLATTLGKSILHGIGLKSLVPIVGPVFTTISFIAIANDLLDFFNSDHKQERKRKELEKQVREANRQQQETMARQRIAMQQLGMQLQLELKKREEETLQALDQQFTLIVDKLLGEIKRLLAVEEHTKGQLSQSIEQLNRILTSAELLKQDLQ